MKMIKIVFEWLMILVVIAICITLVNYIPNPC